MATISSMANNGNLNNTIQNNPQTVNGQQRVSSKSNAISQSVANNIISTNKTGAANTGRAGGYDPKYGPAYSVQSNINPMSKGASSVTNTNNINAVSGSAATSRSNRMLSQLSGAYTQGQAFVSSVNGRQNPMSSLAADYAYAKKTFDNSLATSVNNLQTSARTMRRRGYSVAGATPQATQNNVNAVVGNVRNFVNSFNNTNNLLNGYSPISRGISQQAMAYSDNKNFANNLNSVGINVGKNGQLSVDSSRLSQALTNNNANTSYVLDSMAARAQNNASRTASQANKLFPSFNQMMGSNADISKQMYTANLSKMTAQYQTNKSNMMGLQ